MGAATGQLTIKDIFDIGSNVTLVSGLIFVLVGGYRRWWVWGDQYRELKADMLKQLDEARTDLRAQLTDERTEKQEWKSLALRNLEVAKVLVSGSTPPVPPNGVAR